MPETSKKNWADDAGDEDEVLPPTEVIGPDASGIKTVISYINEDGRIVKVTRKFKVSKVTHTVHKRVAARKAWAKFGDEAGRKPGPDPSTTTLSEHIPVKLSLKQSAAEEEEAISAMDALKKQGDKVVVCRVCKGDHWTSKCPYKDSLGALTEAVAEATAAVQAEPAAPSAGGKYVPPSLRAGAAGVAGRKGESPYGRTRAQEDASTVRVTNISEDTQEGDLQDLFRHFGPITRTYLAKDKITGASKGFAFISYLSRDDAARAIQHLNGYGYDNLILNVEWARQSND